MANGAEENLTPEDVLGKMNIKLKWMARHIEYGTMRFEADFQVVNGVIKQCDFDKLEPHERLRADSDH